VYLSIESGKCFEFISIICETFQSVLQTLDSHLQKELNVKINLKKHIKVRREERKYGKAGREHKAKLDTSAWHSPIELRGNR
jgi:hypothetical protein